jgi:hypothetical protein
MITPGFLAVAGSAGAGLSWPAFFPAYLAKLAMFPECRRSPGCRLQIQIQIQIQIHKYKYKYKKPPCLFFERNLISFDTYYFLQLFNLDLGAGLRPSPQWPYGQKKRPDGLLSSMIFGLLRGGVRLGVLRTWLRQF